MESESVNGFFKIIFGGIFRFLDLRQGRPGDCRLTSTHPPPRNRERLNQNNII